MQLLLISSTIVHGYGYLDHAEADVREIVGDRKSISFVPFAQGDRDAATERFSARLAQMGIETRQVHQRADIESAEVIFVDGGNTFRLLRELYARDLVEAMRRRVRNEGVPYIGSSAGTNVATPSIKTTNDMPIVYPPAFEALGLVPFQINPHYQDPDPASTHKGETREDRLLEYLQENTTPVIGLREGSMLRVRDGVTTLAGSFSARIFKRGEAPYELPLGSAVNLA